MQTRTPAIGGRLDRVRQGGAMGHAGAAMPGSDAGSEGGTSIRNNVDGPPRPVRGGAAFAQCASCFTRSAAAMIASATAFGWLSIATWLPFTRVTVAPMRFAIVSCSFGSIIRSCVATT